MTERRASGRGRLVWSDWAIDNPLAVRALFLVLAVLGLAAGFAMPAQRYPDVSFPSVTIVTRWPGTAANQIETGVTRPIERAVAGLSGVQAVMSMIAPGTSTTVVDFPIGANIGVETDALRSRIEQLRPSLPAGSDPPVIRASGADEVPVLTYVVHSATRDAGEVSRLIDTSLSSDLQAARGIGRISRLGGVDREISVRADPARMAALGVTMAQVADSLHGTARDDPAGSARVGGGEQPLQVINAAHSPQDLANLPLPLPGMRQVRLGDVATIADGAAEPSQFVRFNGQNAVAVEIGKSDGGDEIALERDVHAVFAGWQRRYPDIAFIPVYSTVRDTRESLSATIRALVEGIVLTTFAVWLFLRDWRATAIAAVAMPASLLPALLVMWGLGFSLNMVTLLALTLVIGILVDDAIVEVENIRRYLDAGAPPEAAARAGAAQIGLAVVATTLAIVVVFLPVSFMAGVPGRFFHEFGITVAAAVLASLAVARLLTPVLAARHLRPHASRAIDRALPARLLMAIARPWRVLAGGAVMIVLTLVLALQLPTGFQPVGDPDHVLIKVQGPPGATWADMDRVIGDATRLLLRQSDVAGVFAQDGTKIIGNIGGDRGQPDLRDATLTVMFRADHARTAQAFREAMRLPLAAMPGARINLLNDAAGADVQTNLVGEDPNALRDTAERLVKQMRTIPGLFDPRIDASVGGSVLQVRPDGQAMARLGVSSDTLARVLKVATEGDADAQLPRMERDGQAVPVRLRLSDGSRASLDTLRNLLVPTAAGVTTLGAVASLDLAGSPDKITRFDQKREVRIEADLRAGTRFGDAMGAIAHLPAMADLPPGLSTKAFGNQRSMKELFASLGIVFSLAIGLMYAILVLLYGDLRRPLVVLAALPPAVTGAIVGLWLFGFALDLPALIGLLMLLGLVAKNSILIVDQCVDGERCGLGAAEAALAAVRVRMRPILMTSLAMVAGMLPTALALGEGSEFRQPLAVTLIGGLASSTFASLVFVPALYIVLINRRQRQVAEPFLEPVG